MILVFLAFCLGIFVPLAAAADSNPWSLNGYGTVGAAYSDEDRAEYLPDLRLTGGPGRWSTTVDTRFAAQVEYRPSSRWAAVAQMIAEDTVHGSFEPILEWANVQFAPTDSLRVRAGRIALGTNLTSEYRKVGFALPWVRPPAELYRLVPITRSDGVDVSYDLQRGELSARLQLVWGREDNAVLDARGWGAFQEFRWRDLQLHLSYLNSTLTVHSAGELFDAVAELGPEGQALADRYALDDAPAHHYGAGFRYDPGGFFVLGEWAALHTDALYGDAHAWYVSLGRRFGSVMPYLTHARSSPDRPTLQGLTVGAYPPPADAVAAALNRQLDRSSKAIADQRTLSIGGRWDVLPRLALKAQLDLVDVGSGSPGTFSELEAGAELGRVNVFSVTADFVF